MYGYIYKTTNLINNRVYIGQHKSEVFDFKYKGSGKILLQAFEKYGKDNFKCELIQECFSKDELDQCEKFYIDKYSKLYSDLYNITQGGFGGSASGYISIRNIDGKCKRILPDELDQYVKLGYVKGGPLPTQETVLKRANIMKNVVRTPQWCKHISEGQRGKIIPDSSKIKMSNAKNSIKKKVLCVQTGIIYESLSQAEKLTGISRGNIRFCCIGKYKHAGNFQWKYV